MSHYYRGKVGPDGTVDPFVTTIAKLILEGHITISVLARKSGVSQTTIRSWLNGKTKRPCRITLEFVLNRLGHRMAIMPTDAVRPNAELHTIRKYTWTPADIVRTRGRGER